MHSKTCRSEIVTKLRAVDVNVMHRSRWERPIYCALGIYLPCGPFFLFYFHERATFLGAASCGLFILEELRKAHIWFWQAATNFNVVQLIIWARESSCARSWAKIKNCNWRPVAMHGSPERFGSKSFLLSAFRAKIPKKRAIRY